MMPTTNAALGGTNITMTRSFGTGISLTICALTASDPSVPSSSDTVAVLVAMFTVVTVPGRSVGVGTAAIASSTAALTTSAKIGRSCSTTAGSAASLIGDGSLGSAGVTSSGTPPGRAVGVSDGSGGGRLVMASTRSGTPD